MRITIDPSARTRPHDLQALVEIYGDELVSVGPYEWQLRAKSTGQQANTRREADQPGEAT